MSEEHVGEKIDRLNSVISQLMIDLESNYEHGRKVSVFSEVNNSKFEHSEVNDTFIDNDEFYVPPSVLEKFQEALTEIDRLAMQVEDLCGERLEGRMGFELFLSGEQVRVLYENLGKVLENYEEKMVFRVERSGLEGLGVRLEGLDVVERLKEVQVENLRLRKEIELGASASSSREKRLRERDLISKHVELEKKLLVMSEKEQELDRKKEEYDVMLAKAEILIHEYTNMVKSKEKINTEKKLISKVASQDFTRTRTTASFMYPLSNSFLYSGFISYKQEIEKKIADFEKLVKKKYKKNTKKTPVKIPEIFEEFKNREEMFDGLIAENVDWKEKEKIVMEYLKESREFLANKIGELRRYQNFLMENWVKVNGEPAGIESVKQVLCGYLQRFSKGVKERQELDERAFRCKKIDENVRRVVGLLQKHREKISVERQSLFKQLQDIEKYLKIIANLNRVSI